MAGTTLGPEVVVVVFEAAGAGREENEGVMVAWMVCEPLLSVGPFWTAVVVLLGVVPCWPVWLGASWVRRGHGPRRRPKWPAWTGG